MFAFTFPLALCLALASGRDYRLRAPPSVTHSIVNLGKMELNVYLNSKPAGSPINEYEISHQSKPTYTSESGECPCQQNRLKNRNQGIYSPPDMLRKILMNNDLFKDPRSSSCCSSHEQIEEEFYMEFNPKTGAQPMRQGLPSIQHLPQIVQNFPPLQALPMNKPMFKPMQYLPLLFDTLYKGPQNQKKKMVEIIMFPTKKPVANTTPAKSTPVTPEILVVGDKKTTMVYDLLATNSSVKKDLNKEVVEHLKDMDAVINTDKTTHTMSNNTV